MLIGNGKMDPLNDANTFAEYVTLVFKFYNQRPIVGVPPAAEQADPRWTRGVRELLLNTTASTFLATEFDADYGWRRLQLKDKYGNVLQPPNDEAISVVGFDDDLTKGDMEEEYDARRLDIYQLVDPDEVFAVGPNQYPAATTSTDIVRRYSRWGRTRHRDPDTVTSRGRRVFLRDNDEDQTPFLNYGAYPVGLYSNEDDPPSRAAQLMFPVRRDADTNNYVFPENIEPLFTDRLFQQVDLGYLDADEQCGNKWSARTLRDYQTLHSRFPRLQRRGTGHSHYTDPPGITLADSAFRDFALPDEMNRTNTRAILEHDPAYALSGTQREPYPLEIIRMYAMAWYAKIAIMENLDIYQTDAEKWRSIEAWKKTPLGAYIDSACMPYKNNYTVVIQAKLIALSMYLVYDDLFTTESTPHWENFMPYKARLWSNVKKPPGAQEESQWLAAPAALPGLFVPNPNGEYRPLEILPDYIMEAIGTRSQELLVFRVQSLHRDPVTDIDVEWWKALCTALAVWTHYGRTYTVTAALIYFMDDPPSVTDDLKTDTQRCEVCYLKLTADDFRNIYSMLVYPRGDLPENRMYSLPPDALLYDTVTENYVNINAAPPAAFMGLQWDLVQAFEHNTACW